ncbi:MAG: branched-chain amino acid ABC transporter permease, partial [Pseudomonadota bacterium]
LVNKWPWLYNYSASGQITATETSLFGILITGPNTEPWATYLFCLTFLFIFGWIARNLVRGRIGRQWMAIRDMDIAAEIIGVNPLKAKLTAFAISSFYIGMAGALYFAVWNGAAEPTESFAIDKSFDVLFMIIIGGLGSIFGSLIGAAFIVLLPVLMKNLLVGMLGWPTDIAEYLQLIVVGGLIVFFLIKEPHGIAALWRTIKEKLRLWPFPY